MTSLTHFVRADGSYYGQSDEVPDGCFAVEFGPLSASCRWNGVSWIDPLQSLDVLRTAANATVDLAAEAYRLTFITAGSGQAMAYQQKLDEARALIANPSLTAADCPHVFAEVGITGETAEAVANVVVGMHAAWQVKSADIEHKRLSAKAAIDAAETAEAIAEAEKVVWED